MEIQSLESLMVMEVDVISLRSLGLQVCGKDLCDATQKFQVI
jgi:hypothetical protein